MRKVHPVGERRKSYQIYCDGPGCGAHGMMYAHSFKEVEDMLNEDDGYAEPWTFTERGDFCSVHETIAQRWGLGEPLPGMAEFS